MRAILDDVAGVEAEQARAAKVQDALYRIADLASAAQDMQEFYRAIHEIVGELMYAGNFYVALYDEERELINWPYWLDEVDVDAPDPHQWDAVGEGRARGLTAYVLRTGRPQLVTYERFSELTEHGEVELIGLFPKGSTWLGVPLLAEGRTVGVLVVQSYAEGVGYTEQDKDLLSFVGQHVGAALSRARAIEETRQRNAELALINSVQAAIAGELELEAIYDAVGDRIRDVFDAQAVQITMLDEATGLLHDSYIFERGERFQVEPYSPVGFTKHVLETGEALLIVENLDIESERYGSRVDTGEKAKSVLFVPLIARGKPVGVVSLQNIDREHAFDEADQRLLTTLSSSLSVALENARLVHETRERNAELALINSVQSALAGELEMQAIYDVVGNKIQEIFDAQGVAIVTLDETGGLLRFPFLIEHGKRLWPDPTGVAGFSRHVLERREPLLVNEAFAAEAERYGATLVAGELPKAALYVPLFSRARATGVVMIENFEREHAFDDADQRLLTTLAGSLSVALENARLVHETRQRNAELALINSVQEALAGELDLQAIYDVVGDKIQEIFDAQVVDIGIYDEASGLIHFPYTIERGKRFPDEPFELIGFRKHVMETGEPLLLNEKMMEAVEHYGNPAVLAGELAKSWLGVPLVAGGRPAGVISLQNVDREHAFGESDEQLLETLAGSLSVALENARLVHETRQRNAELALINSVQEGIAGELDAQAIYDVVGDKIQEIFDAQVVDIGIFDFAAGLTRYPYTIEKGVRFPADRRAPISGSPLNLQVIQTRAPVLVNDVPASELERGEALPVVQGEPALSVLFAPLITGDEVRGRISLQNLDRTNAFTENDVRLLTTLASSLSVALENARLVHETRQRNAELALINSVQDAIAGELDRAAIYDAVGDRIREIFDAQVVAIRTLDAATGLIHAPYIIERGERLQEEPMAPVGFSKHVLETRESVLVVEDLPDVSERFGSPVLSGVAPKSVLFVPLITAGEATGTISLQNIDREHAFSASDQQLLETLAGSLSVALENARLVDETRQRNAELGLINGVQDAIAGELETQAIYDAVGDRIQEVFDAQAVFISTVDEASGHMAFPYIIERGERLTADPAPPGGVSRHVLETGESLLLTDVDAEIDQYGSTILAGDWPKSSMFVPLVTSGRVTGIISLQNVDRAYAFSESDRQLLETLAGSLSVALENARLVHETRQRNAELALINGVQEAIAGELDAQAIYDAVGDKIREVFDAQAVQIRTVDEATGLLHTPYIIERGERMEVEPAPPGGFSKHVLEAREPLSLTENVAAEMERYGSIVTVGEAPKSVLFVPLVSGGQATGVISLQNVDREHAFSASDQQLLETLAGSLSVALENARLVHETRQRNAELALINGVQDAIAGELDQQAIYDAVGDKIQEVFDAQAAMIIMLDEASGQAVTPYAIERGERQQWEPMEPWGFAQHVLEGREPLLINEDVVGEAARLGFEPRVVGDMPKSVLFVPLVAGGRATGVISLQNVDREHAFGSSDQQLLETLAGSLSVALENARLVHETRQRNAELALINGVQEAIAGELDSQAIYDAVGDKIRDAFDAQVVSIATVDDAAGLIQYPYLIERGARLQAEPRPMAGFAKHVLETREPLLIAENLDVEAERYGSTVVAGENAKSVLFVPLVAGGKATGVISLQNIDREHAFSESDRQLLTTVAGSVSVALENARLVSETRQRVGELATVNSIGQALASQLELDGLIELVGEQVRETFDADIAYVALHDQAAGRIEFAYHYEAGDLQLPAPMEYGEGLTSQILESRAPLLLNREGQREKGAMVGTPARSYLGVPILLGSRSIGVISVQSIEEDGRFTEADAGLLSTIAANVGVAIQNARLFTEIERQRQYLESLVAISPAAVVVMDVEEIVTDWNPAAAELFGYSADEAVGRHVDDLVFGSSRFDTDEGRELTREAMTTGRAQRITQRRRRDGSLVDVELMLVPLTVDGSHAGLLAIYHDVTELQRARQEAEAATQAKSAFLATMSHEIRTPMNAVIGMTDLLLGTELTGEQREFAEVVHSSGDALLHVIDDILDYSKIEAGKLDLEHAPFNLRDCVEGALDIVAPRAWEKELELGCLIDEGAPAGVLGDEARLRQVLLNLLSNAVKFTERGEVMVLVDADESAAGARRIELAVRDTGIGIPADRMDDLFTSFSQVDASTTRRFGGTGLGLAISKRLVELMGGTISVESEQGKGSIFRISLPAQAAEVPAKIPLDEGLPHLAGKRILVVDDNATNREIVTRHARSWGMEPVAIELPAAALELIENGEPFDVAVLDMMMPGMDGLALAGEIRSRRSAQELPLLLLTSLGRLPQTESSSVFSAQLSKPLKASQLYNTLLQLLTAGGTGGGEEVEAVTDGKLARSALRILLAEDNAMNQKVALRLLERLGYRADVATTGLEAIGALERQPYDVILMDVQMPELDGLDATRRICERWPEESRPHIIAMTANALPEDREACFAAGMNDYVAKPIRSEELAAALKRAKPLRNGDAAPTPAGSVSLDAGALENLRDLGGDAFLGEVVDAFLADAPELIATLRRALDERSHEELRRAAHTLKSNGATLGAEGFAELCRTLEQRAKSGELDGAEELVGRIEQEYRPLEEALVALRTEPVP